MDCANVTFEGVTEKAVAVTATGDLEIEGWLARYNEPDRTGEYFMPGAFSRTWEKFKALGAPILYQHRDGAQLGQVTELEEKAGGVWMKGIIPKPTEAWAVDVYDRLKRGMVKGLSSKGLFTKQLLPGGGARIKEVDLWEASITPVAVGTTATIEAVAQKALSTFAEPTPEEIAAVDAYFERKFRDLRATLDALSQRPVE